MLPQKKSQLRRNAWYRQQLLFNSCSNTMAGADLAIDHSHFGLQCVTETAPATLETSKPARTKFSSEYAWGDQA